jgi:hypothetical protein
MTAKSRESPLAAGISRVKMSAWRAGRVAAARITGLRKVGAPQGRMLANGQSGRPEGKCHREQTADGTASPCTGKGETVR